MKKSELKELIKECYDEILNEVQGFPHLCSKWKGKSIYYLFQVGHYQYDLVEMVSGIMKSVNLPALKKGESSLEDIEEYLTHNGYKKLKLEQ